MAIPAAAIAKAAIGVLSNEKTRKAAGWVLVAILSPIILLIAAFCSILGGSADHNSSILDLCFYGGTLPADIPAEYRTYIEDMQASFALLDERITEINSMTEDGASLDAIRVKAFFYALYFGAESPSSRAHQQFVDCFVTYEERTRPLDSTDSEDESAGEPEEETYTVAIPITDIATIAVRRHIIEMLGRGDLAGKLAGEVHAVRLDELKQPVELIRGDESVDRIRKQDQLCLFQFLPQRRKVLFIAFDPLAHRENGEFMFRVQRLQIEGRVDCGGIFPLGAGVQNKNFHDSSSNS